MWVIRLCGSDIACPRCKGITSGDTFEQSLAVWIEEFEELAFEFRSNSFYVIIGKGMNPLPLLPDVGKIER